MTPTEIPAEVKARIEAEAKSKFKWKVNIQFFILGAEWLYCEMMNNAPYIFGPERTKKNQ